MLDVMLDVVQPHAAGTGRRARLAHGAKAAYPGAVAQVMLRSVQPDPTPSTISVDGALAERRTYSESSAAWTCGKQPGGQSCPWARCSVDPHDCGFGVKRSAVIKLRLADQSSPAVRPERVGPRAGRAPHLTRPDPVDREPEERCRGRALAGGRRERRVQRSSASVVVALVGAGGDVGVVRGDEGQPRGAALGDDELHDAVCWLQTEENVLRPTVGQRL